MKKIILLALIFASLLGYSQEEITITGKVTFAENGEVTPGIKIQAKNDSTFETLTDLDGKYTITVPKDVQTLVFSCMGKEIKEEKIDARTVIDVALKKEDFKDIKVIVTGAKSKTEYSRTTKNISFFKLFVKARTNKFRFKKYQILCFNDYDTIRLKNNKFNNIPYYLKDFNLIIKNNDFVVELNDIKKHLNLPDIINDQKLYIYINIDHNNPDASIRIVRLNNCYETEKIIKKGKGFHTVFISDVKM